MFWIYGGALVGGSASLDIYNGEMLSSRGDVVVVTINYRVQALGFLYTGSDDGKQNTAPKWHHERLADGIRTPTANCHISDASEDILSTSYTREG